MESEILYQPAYAMTIVNLGANEMIKVEAGAMVGMSQGIELTTKASGGLFSSLKRSVLGGESFFVNEFRASANGGQISLAPALPGDMCVLDQNGERALMVQSGAYVASSQDIEVDTKWGGAKTFFASEGLFMLRCSGQGELILASYGAIHGLQLAPGEQYTVDTGHIVAFDEGMGFSVRAVGGIKSTLFGGEGLVVDLTGPGRVLMQTRSTDAFLSWLTPEMQRRMPKSN